MKGFIAILLVALAAGAYAKPPKCPKLQAIWSFEWLIPHQDCSKFYQCANGSPVTRICPKGLYYNPETWQCDYPENVKCNRPKTAEREEEEEVLFVPIGQSTTYPNGCPTDREMFWLIPSVLNCRVFYYCVEGRRIPSLCPEGLAFNPLLQVCDFPENAGCKSWFNKE